MHIHLPNSAFLGNIDPFFAGFDTSDPDTLHITTNEKWISVHPIALTMIAALGQTITPKKITFDNITAKSKHYLERMRLFSVLNIQSDITITEHDPAGRFIPLTQINTSTELSTFITEMIPLLHLQPQHTKPIQYIISELIRNVLEHAQTTHGALVAAQYYKKSNTIRIGIADRGRGIAASIRQSYAVENDLEAIKLALTPGITGTTRKEGGTEQNAGAGLFFIKSIATVNKDFFVIYSGNAMYKLLRSKTPKLHADPFEDRHSKTTNLPFWQGTLIGIDINLDSTKEFTDLLDLIHETYLTAVKERKQQRRVQPRFT